MKSINQGAAGWFWVGMRIGIILQMFLLLLEIDDEIQASESGGWRTAKETGERSSSVHTRHSPVCNVK